MKLRTGVYMPLYESVTTINSYFIGFEGPTLVMRGNPVVTGEKTATFVSPWLPKSEKAFGKCLRFKYKMVGRGVKSLKIYQETQYGFERQPIWDDGKGAGFSSSLWHYGQTSISTTSIFRVSITFWTNYEQQRSKLYCCDVGVAYKAAYSF